MRPAGFALEEHYAANLKSEGYERVRAAQTALTNKETGVTVLVWGDDFTFLGRERYFKEIGAKMAEWYDIKIRGMMGFDAGDDKEIRILNLGFDENAKSLDMPTAKDYDAKGGEDDEELDAQPRWLCRLARPSSTRPGKPQRS